MSCSENGATELLDEPLLGLFLGDSLEVAEGASSGSAAGNSLASAGKDDVEVHTIDTDSGIVPRQTIVTVVLRLIRRR